MKGGVTVNLICQRDRNENISLKPNKMKTFSSIIVLLIFMFVINLTAWAIPSDKPHHREISPSASTTATPNPFSMLNNSEKEKEDNPVMSAISGVKDFVYDKTIGPIKKIEEAMDFLKKIFKHGIGFIVNILIGEMLEGVYNTVSNWMSEWIFLTPKLINAGWIKGLWNFCFVISIALTVAGIVFSMFSLKRGRLKNDKELGEFNATKLISVIVSCILFSYFSLFICDMTINIENAGLNALARNVLWEKYSAEKDKLGNSLVRQDNEPITKDNISFSDFSGDKIIRMAFGLEVFSENQEKDTWDSDELYTGYYNSTFFGFLKTGGGLLIMILAMIILIIMGLFGLLKYGVLGLLGAGSPFWASWATFKGDGDPILGFINIFARTAGLSLLFDLAWLGAAHVTTNVATNEFKLIGAGKQLLACIIFIIALALATWFWFRWVVKVVKNPMTLAGADVRTSIGNTQQSIGKVMKEIGMHYGLGGIVQQGAEMEAAGATQKQIADEIKNGRFDRDIPIKDRLTEAKRNAGKNLLDRQLNILKRKGVRYDNAGESVYEIMMALRSIDNPCFNGEELNNILTAAGYANTIYHGSDGKFFVDEDHLGNASAAIRRELVQNHMKEHLLDNEPGYIINNFSDDKLSRIKTLLNKNNLDHKSLFSIKADGDNINAIKHKAENLEEILSFLNSANVEETQFGSLPGYLIKSNTAQARKMEEFFGKNNIRYERTGNKFLVARNDFESVQTRIDDMNSVISNDLKGFNEKYEYNGNNKDEYAKIKNALGKIGVKHRASENLWLDENNRNIFLSKVVSPGDEYMEGEDRRNFLTFEVENEQDAKNIRQLLKDKLPEACVLDSRKHEIVIDSKYSNEMDKIVKDYQALTPYWELNGKYYYKDKYGITVKHTSKPENGRFMGKYLNRKGSVA